MVAVIPLSLCRLHLDQFHQRGATTDDLAAAAPFVKCKVTDFT